ncbi:hypothetical protein MP638_003839 [Amoeboaphelidium occidentale]|nr:hypothetical protein MP638_003839 [Amoeboaphelidium occidentale]
MILKNLIYAASLALSAFSAPTEYKDVAETSVSVDEMAIPSNNHHSVYLVTVLHKENLLEDGKVVAKRLSNVRLVFDVEDGQLMCNGEMVPAGVSNKRVAAEILTGISQDKRDQADLIKQKFDKGIVDITFEVKVAQVSLGIVTVRRLYISEHIRQVNGNSVLQKDYVQHVMDIYPSGEFKLQQVHGHHEDKHHEHHENKHHGHGHKHHGHHESKHKNAAHALPANVHPAVAPIDVAVRPHLNHAALIPKFVSQSSRNGDKGNWILSDYMTMILTNLAMWVCELNPIMRGFLFGLSATVVTLTIFAFVQLVSGAMSRKKYEPVQVDFEQQMWKPTADKDKFYKRGNESAVSSVNLLTQQE